MLTRGKILRDANSGPGLLIIDGKQHAFTLEDMWTSDAPPRLGMTVDVLLSESGAPERVSAVPESQLARESANVAVMEVRRHSEALLSSGSFKRLGPGACVALGVLLIGWSFLPTLLIQFPFNASVSLWSMRGYLAAPNPRVAFGQNPQFLSSGVWGLLGFVALAAPLVTVVWKDKRAALGSALPLLFMILVFTILRASFGHAGPPASANSGFEEFGSAIVSEAAARVWASTKFGAGWYVSLIAATYLAFSGVRRFLAGVA